MQTTGTPHLSDDHMIWGVAIFALYFVQVALGAIIHFVKPKSFSVNRRRPAQNYLHAILGLLIIALSFYQVRFSMKWDDRAILTRPTVGKNWLRDRMATTNRPWKRRQWCQHRLVYLGRGKSPLLSTSLPRYHPHTVFLPLPPLFPQLLPILYFAGLVLLRRQYKQERSGKPAADDYESDTDEINMQHRGQYRDEPEGPRY